MTGRLLWTQNYQTKIWRVGKLPKAMKKHLPSLYYHYQQGKRYGFSRCCILWYCFIWQWLTEFADFPFLLKFVNWYRKQIDGYILCPLCLIKKVKL
jgi:uncharacterized protein Usg